MSVVRATLGGGMECVTLGGGMECVTLGGGMVCVYQIPYLSE